MRKIFKARLEALPPRHRTQFLGAALAWLVPALSAQPLLVAPGVSAGVTEEAALRPCCWSSSGRPAAYRSVTQSPGGSPDAARLYPWPWKDVRHPAPAAQPRALVRGVAPAGAQLAPRPLRAAAGERAQPVQLQCFLRVPIVLAPRALPWISVCAEGDVSKRDLSSSDISCSLFFCLSEPDILGS